MSRRDDWVEDDVVFEDDESRSLRPYLLTGGRTHAEVEGLVFETLVQKVDGVDGTRLRFESAQVVDMCDSPISVAEISAHMSIPLGATMVLIGDLISSGHLVSHRTINAASDAGVSLLTRIIAGVKQL
jgi:hypothetical protein